MKQTGDSKKQSNTRGLRKKFDREGFLLSFGLGGGFVALSAFLFWVYMSGIPSSASVRPGYFSSQRVTRFIPDSVKEWLFLGLAGAFGLFGIVLIGAGVVWIIRKRRDRLDAG